jgi:hypothetical protein
MVWNSALGGLEYRSLTLWRDKTEALSLEYNDLYETGDPCWSGCSADPPTTSCMLVEVGAALTLSVAGSVLPTSVSF